jgi:Mg2+ and Co2+ transporter CorA
MELFWLGGDRVERRAPLELPALLAREDGFVWLDAPECDEATTKTLAEVFRFHPLAVRDCRERSHIAKLQVYPDALFVILHAPEPGEQGAPPVRQPRGASRAARRSRAKPQSGQIHLLELDYFVGHRFLVTVHGPVNPEVPLEKALRETRAVARRLEQGRFVPRSPAELSHAIVSALVARQEAFVLELTRKVATLERRVLSGEKRGFEEALEEMFRVRHELLTLRTMAAGGRELFARMAALTRHLPPESQPFIEDLVDHFERVRSVCDSEKEFLQGVVDFYQSRTTVKMNIAMERLALISAVMLPLSLLAAIYGMNIIVNDQTQTWELGLVLGTMGALAVALLIWARRQGWW